MDPREAVEVRQSVWRARMVMSTRPELIREVLGSYLVDGVSAVEVRAAFVLRTHAAGMMVSGDRGQQFVEVPKVLVKYLEDLRRTCYDRDAGTWFSVYVRCTVDGQFAIDVDDMSEPAFRGQPLDDVQWQAEWFLNRRHDQHMPAWWMEKCRSH